MVFFRKSLDILRSSHYIPSMFLTPCRSSHSFRPSFAVVPHDMSCVNALFALCLKAKGEFPFECRPSIAQMISFFQSGTYCERIANKVIRVSFENFPALNVTGYDSLYGAGAAQLALIEYEEIRPSNRIDTYDKTRFRDLRAPYSHLLLKKQEQHFLRQPPAVSKAQPPQPQVLPQKQKSPISPLEKGSLKDLRSPQSAPLPRTFTWTPSPSGNSPSKKPASQQPLGGQKTKTPERMESRRQTKALIVITERPPTAEIIFEGELDSARE